MISKKFYVEIINVMLLLILVAIYLHIINMFECIDYTVIGNGFYARIVCDTLRNIGKKVKFIPYDNKIKKYLVQGKPEFFEDFDITYNKKHFYVPFNKLNKEEIKLLEKHTNTKNLDKWQNYVCDTLYNFDGVSSINISSLPKHDTYFNTGLILNFNDFALISSIMSTWKTKHVIFCSAEIKPYDIIVSYHMSKNMKQYSLENYIVDKNLGIHKLCDTLDIKSPVFSLKFPRKFTGKTIHPFYLPPSVDPILSMIITVISCYY